MNSCTSAESPCSGCEECHDIAFQSFRRRLNHRAVTLGPYFSLIASARRVGFQIGLARSLGVGRLGHANVVSAHGAILMT
jgi:hypothetical protein